MVELRKERKKAPRTAPFFIFFAFRLVPRRESSPFPQFAWAVAGGVARKRAAADRAVDKTVDKVVDKVVDTAAAGKVLVRMAGSAVRGRKVAASARRGARIFPDAGKDWWRCPYSSPSL